MTTDRSRACASRRGGVLSDRLLERTPDASAAAAAHIRVGCLTVVLPDGSRHGFGDR